MFSYLRIDTLNFSAENDLITIYKTVTGLDPAVLGRIRTAEVLSATVVVETKVVVASDGVDRGGICVLDIVVVFVIAVSLVVVVKLVVDLVLSEQL